MDTNRSILTDGGAEVNSPCCGSLLPTTPQRTINHGRPEPNPEWIRGICPECGDYLVSNMWHLGGRGYIIQHTCWSGDCDYRRVL